MKLRILVLFFVILSGPLVCNDSGRGPMFIENNCPEGQDVYVDDEGNAYCKESE